MRLLRLASKETKRLYLDDSQEDWVEVKVDLSERDFNSLLRGLPGEFNSETGLTPAQSDDYASFVFEALVTGWSLEDENGQPVSPTLDVYHELSSEASNVIDRVVVEHFNSLTPDADERKKSEGRGE
jgi:hypothetical protein